MLVEAPQANYLLRDQEITVWRCLEDAVERPPERQRPHIRNDPFVLPQTAAAQGNHRQRAVDAGHMNCMIGEVAGNRNSAAASLHLPVFA